MEKNKQWKNELLMETLRSKSSKTTIESLAKSCRLNLLERRYNIDAVEKQVLQTALDNLQNNIQIKNRGHLVERLESITRQRELKFTDNANTNSLFISSDMFYLEILLDPHAGTVKNVKVHHECSSESESNQHLIDVLRKNDFIDFTKQLEGFQSIYQLNAESKIKSKAFIAIQALEADLTNIFNIESTKYASPEALVLSSQVGLLTPRRGGHPASLLFFVRPTELLNFEQKKMDSLTHALQVASSAKKTIGNSVTINLEAAAPSNKLQIAPLLMKNGKSDSNFTFSQISLHNSAMLPAAFVLRLNQAMPITSLYVEEIKKITNNLAVTDVDSTAIKLENPLNDVQTSTSLINLIVNHESQGTYENGQKGLFITLADQSHCYFITDNPELSGQTIKSIQLTEPSQVTKIIKLLRQQAIFNALIGSCVRKRNSRQDFDATSYMFEVNVVSLQLIQIFVEHKESIVTVEFDLSDIKQLSCRINGSEQQFDSKLENYIFRVFQKTMSIPMVLRSLIKYWDNEALEFQRLQKRLYNNGIYGSVPDPRKDADEKKDDSEKGDAGGFTDIFFKTNESKGEKRSRQDSETTNADNHEHRLNKLARVMSFEMNNDNNVMPKSLLAEDLINESSFSPSSIVSGEGLGRKSVSSSSKAGTPLQKALDIFEFNDPSPPPPNTVMVPLQSPLAEERSRKIPTPRASPSTSSSFVGIDKKNHDIELFPLKNQFEDPPMIGQPSVSITPLTSSSSFVYEKPKSEKKKKRKREESDGSSPSMAKKKSSDSLGSSPSKKSSSGSAQLMGKPSASFKSRKSPLPGSIESMDDLSFLNYGVDQQAISVPSPLPSPQSLIKNSNSSQGNRKSSLSAVINKLKSEMNETVPSGEEKKGEYQIKSSGSDGIKITFNKTKSSKGLKSPKHTGLKPGVNSGPASKKSSQSSKSSSHKLLFQKSSSSGSLSSPGCRIPSPKSSSQPGKSSSREKSKEIINPFASFTGSSNDMLKNMLNLATPTPCTDIIKAFDRNFQIPKLSARGKSDDKPLIDEAQPFNMIHPRSAPSTPIQSSTPSPTMDYMREGSSGGHYHMGHPKFLPSSQHQNKFIDDKKLFKSMSTEQLLGNIEKPSLGTNNMRSSEEINHEDFQTFLRAQSKLNDSSVSMRQISMEGMQSGGSQQMTENPNMLRDDLRDLNFIGNEI